MPDTTVPAAADGAVGSRGADEAVADLYAAHWSRMVRVAWLLVRDQQVAEEIVQDALVGIHGRWARLQDHDRAVAYLRRSVVNGARSVLRHRTVERSHLLAEQGSAPADHVRGPSAEEQVLDHVEHERMLEVLGTLPRRQREVLVLRYYLDLSESQIADALDIAPGSVKTHAHRGLAALRDVVSPEEPVNDDE
jgi:RNA polymerase sigma-70 factor (sigma-E family)